MKWFDDCSGNSFHTKNVNTVIHFQEYFHIIGQSLLSCYSVLKCKIYIYTFSKKTIGYSLLCLLFCSQCKIIQYTFFLNEYFKLMATFEFHSILCLRLICLQLIWGQPNYATILILVIFNHKAFCSNSKVPFCQFYIWKILPCSWYRIFVSDIS